MEMENREITVREATNHGNNQLMIGFLAILAVPAFVGLVAELNLFQRLDDGIIFLVGGCRRRVVFRRAPSLPTFLCASGVNHRQLCAQVGQ